MKKKRSNRIIMTNEARTLRLMRIESKLSMRKAGELLGKSDTYIAHIENGRMDIPEEEKLDALLNIYGGIKRKTFYEKARNFIERRTARDDLDEILNHISEEKIKTVLKIIQNLI